MKIRSAVVNEINDPYVLEDLTISEMREDEILVKIVASGMCHSDDFVRSKQTMYKFPIVLGHEGSGIVEKIGSAVHGFEPGDHVVLSFEYCGHCDSCLTGVPASCDDWGTLNERGRRADETYYFHREDGSPVSNYFSQSSFSTYTLARERNLTKVTKDVDLRLVGPLGCGFMTGSGTVLNGLKPAPGSSIAVFGTGAVGLAAMMAAKISGCTKIIGIDIHDNRLETAKELGATHVINSKTADVHEEIKKLTNGKGVNYTVDTTGVPPVIRTAIEVLAKGGVAAPVGGTIKPIELNTFMDLAAQNKAIQGVLMGNSIPQLSIPQLIEFFEAGNFAFDKLVNFYKFEDINQAAADSLSGKVVKPVLIMDEDYVPGQ
ncbi:NAD(P)-dependent alcohol dehydrogenase [Cohnella abietis]|uniref:Aryl-alcohol dehydrogenase n=1 Tax=Cohnella abietis TaxID=2507935 RepID=A0A3T1D5I5_9BACL|nr:NAD(P)-dependent alcohol dehydrogenase [Cohnella abietis]BBI33364.1 aryl-alcohol dehydrogenase [Cohnella abietis]